MDDKKKLWIAWSFYDWANSAFATSLLAGLLPVYFATMVVPEEGVQIDGAFFNLHLSGVAIWTYGVSASVLFATLIAPLLGYIADFKGMRFCLLSLWVSQAHVFLHGWVSGWGQKEHS